MLERISRNYTKIITVIILTAIFARIVFLFITPIDSWSTDSSNHARLGVEIATFNEIPGYDYYVADFFHWNPPMYHLVEAGFYKIIPSLKVFEVISLVISISTIALAYLSFKMLGNKELALLGTLFLAIYPVDIRLSTSIMTDAFTLFFTFLAFYCLLLLEKRKVASTKYFVLLTISLGLLLLTKHIGFIVLGFAFVWGVITKKNFKKYLLVIFIASLIGIPWYIRNYSYTGNIFFWPVVEQVTVEKQPSIFERIQNLIQQSLTDKTFLISNAYQYYNRFWDSVDPQDFSYRGIESPTPFVDKILDLYLIAGLPFIIFFILGIELKGEFDKIIMVWLIIFILFVFYYFTSWGLNFVPRVGIFMLPVFCYLFSKGVLRLKKYSPLIIIFLVLTSIMFVSFEGFKLYIKNANETLYERSYAWIDGNVPNNSLILSNQWAQISLFAQRDTALTLHGNSSQYSRIYIYDRERSLSKLGCQTSNCTLVYNDTYAVIYRIK
jgi:4-amino-4-deoxy-L-arabinose transferase-like glycosyltransferase